MQEQLCPAPVEVSGAQGSGCTVRAGMGSPMGVFWDGAV